MSALNKVTLTVAVATIIVSGVIFLTGNEIANKDQLKSNLTSAAIDGNEVDAKAGVVLTKKQMRQAKSKVFTSDIAGTIISIASPPGPFLNNQQNLLAPVAPMEPMKKLAMPKGPLQPQEINRTPPSLSKKLGAESVMEKKERLKPALTSVPKSHDTSMPSALVNITKQPNVNMGNRPAWMQTGISQANKNVTNGQTQSNIAMSASSWYNYPPQQYMYIPVPVMPSLNRLPPRMPEFNGSIWQSLNSWSPKPLNNKPVIQEKIAPVQKDAK